LPASHVEQERSSGTARRHRHQEHRGGPALRGHIATEAPHNGRVCGDYGLVREYLTASSRLRYFASHVRSRTTMYMREPTGQERRVHSKSGKQKPSRQATHLSCGRLAPGQDRPRSGSSALWPRRHRQYGPVLIADVAQRALAAPAPVGGAEARRRSLSVRRAVASPARNAITSPRQSARVPERADVATPTPLRPFSPSLPRDVCAQEHPMSSRYPPLPRLRQQQSRHRRLPIIPLFAPSSGFSFVRPAGRDSFELRGAM